MSTPPVVRPGKEHLVGRKLTPFFSDSSLHDDQKSSDEPDYMALLNARVHTNGFFYEKDDLANRSSNLNGNSGERTNHPSAPGPESETLRQGGSPESNHKHQQRSGSASRPQQRSNPNQSNSHVSPPSTSNSDNPFNTSTLAKPESETHFASAEYDFVEPPSPSLVPMPRFLTSHIPNYDSIKDKDRDTKEPRDTKRLPSTQSHSTATTTTTPHHPKRQPSVRNPSPNADQASNGRRGRSQSTSVTEQEKEPDTRTNDGRGVNMSTPASVKCASSVTSQLETPVHPSTSPTPNPSITGTNVPPLHLLTSQFSPSTARLFSVPTSVPESSPPLPLPSSSSSSSSSTSSVPPAIVPSLSTQPPSSLPQTVASIFSVRSPSLHTTATPTPTTHSSASTLLPSPTSPTSPPSNPLPSNHPGYTPNGSTPGGAFTLAPSTPGPTPPPSTVTVSEAAIAVLATSTPKPASSALTAEQRAMNKLAALKKKI